MEKLEKEKIEKNDDGVSDEEEKKKNKNSQALVIFEDKNEKNEEKKRLHRAYSLIIPHNFNFIIQKMRSRKEEIIKFKNNIQKEITQFFF